MKTPQEQALEIAIQKVRERRLFREYSHVYDPANPQQVGAYPWQVEFHNAGAQYPERAMLAANQVGKTTSAACEVACHLMGRYPEWWQGRKFLDNPVEGWCVGETTETVRDVIQVALLGREGEHGTGWIPAEYLAIKPTYRQAGVSKVIDQIFVDHVSGGMSVASLKSYEQGVEKLRGKALDFVWADEEPHTSIWAELQTRVLRKKGLLFATFTPHKGMSDIVRHFMADPPAKGTWWKNVSWDDAPHLSKEDKDRLWSAYPEHERETRARGIPMLGSGIVFGVSDEDLYCDISDIKPHFARINGVDFGIDHPAAGVFCAHDRDTDTFYVYDCYKSRGHTPVYHAYAMKKHGDWIPVAWPHDGMAKEKGSGVVLKNLYQEQGLYMLPTHAAFRRDDSGRTVEPSVIEILEYMKTNRFKVVRGLHQWFEEKRMYRREEGVIVKEHDDLLSATRYAFVMRRLAKTPGSMVEKKIARPTGPMLGPRRWRT